ncbi:Divalent Anion:Na+ Symporter [Blattamonas nauphoetae]|uniref:Divalent Anion:Na+ Symporter n=1 Tax=Blattamonas nauphoetae TaxID=2049346 RepID=A0ABQ9YKZ3_9EUKA|nr:Divalent Anion:Na+ Symporter [Blattamonas nauphoetae]
MRYRKQLATLKAQRWGKEYLHYSRLKRELHHVFHHYIRNIKPSKLTNTDSTNELQGLLRTQSNFHLPQAQRRLAEQQNSKRQRFRASTTDDASESSSSKLKHSSLRSTISSQNEETQPLLARQQQTKLIPIYENEEIPLKRSESDNRHFVDRKGRKEPSTALYGGLSEQDARALPLSELFTKWSSHFRAEQQRVLRFIETQMSLQRTEFDKLHNNVETTPVTQGTALDLKEQFLELSTDMKELAIFYDINLQGFSKIIRHLSQAISVKGTDGEVNNPLDEEISDLEAELDDNFAEIGRPSVFVDTLQKYYVETFSVGKFCGDGDPNHKTDIELLSDEDFGEYQLELLEEIEDSTYAQIAWRKNSIAAQIVSLQRSAQIGAPELTGLDEVGYHLEKEEATPGTSSALAGITPPPRVKFYHKVRYPVVAVALMVLAIISLVPWPAENARLIRCLGLILYAVILWVTDAIPFHVTGLSIMLFGSLLKLDTTTYGVWAKRIMKSSMRAPFYALIGECTIGLALQNARLDELMLKWVLSKKWGRKPRVFVVCIVVIETILTVFVGNIASTNVVVGMVLPVLREINDDTFARVLLLCIAITGNVAGMASPLASPASLVSYDIIHHTDPTRSTAFGTWTLSLLPVVVVLVGIVTTVLLFIRKPKLESVPHLTFSPAFHTTKQVYMSVILLLLSVTWFLSPHVPVLGSYGTVGMVAIFLCFGFNCVQKTDLGRLPWPVLLLMMGGCCLYECMDASGLLSALRSSVGVAMGSWYSWPAVLLPVVVVLCVAGVLNHTVVTILIIPIVSHITIQRGSGWEAIVIACAAMISSTMLLTSTSFPSLLALSVEDTQKRHYLKRMDLFRTGAVTTALSLLLILSVFYFLAKAWKI